MARSFGPCPVRFSSARLGFGSGRWLAAAAVWACSTSALADGPAKDDAAPLARAVDAARRGEPVETLKLLADAPGPWPDRVALLQGRAFAALDEPEAAVRAFHAAAKSSVPAVRASARRGLVDAWGVLGQHQRRLEAIEAWRLRSPRDRWAQVTSWLATGNLRRAVIGLRELRLRHPGAYLEEVDARAGALAARGHRAKPWTGPELERRIRGLIASGHLRRAERELETKRLGARRRRLLAADIAHRRGQRDRERRWLESLFEAAPRGPDGDQVLWRLAKLEMNADRNPQARRRFEQLKKHFPQSKLAVEGAFLSAWLHYNDEDWDAARRAMLAFAKTYPKGDRADEALWYAGWSAYLGAKDEAALAAFTKLAKTYPRSDLVPFVHYWSGRVHHRAEHPRAAIAAYRAAVRVDPFGYYGMWARRRLASLETKVSSPGPTRPEPGDFSVERAQSALGPATSVQLRRARAFSEAGLFAWVDEELRVAFARLGRAKSDEQAVLRADLARTLGADRLAFRVGLRFRPSDEALADGEPSAWRLFGHLYPPAYAQAVRVGAKRHGVEPALVWSVMRTESHFRDDAASPAGARGLMQLMPATARAIARKVPQARDHAHRLCEPEANVWLGSWYLAQLRNRYHGFLPAVLAAYNAGPGATDRWLDGAAGRDTDEFVERISYRETRRYVRKVMESRWRYQLLAGKLRFDTPKTVILAEPAEGAVAF